ncbi:MAG: SPOR domain-containing protein [Pseudoxanthomonas sp.]
MDSKLKQRIIGAVVLVALAVIFLPMLVKGPAKDGGASDVSLDTPNAPADQFETRELPLAGAGETPAGTQPAPLTTTPAATAPAATAPAAATPAPSSAGGLPASTAGGDWAVTFGAYASSADADTVIARLREAGLDGFRQAATINGQPAWRVRVGPYADRAQAEIARIAAGKVRGDVKATVIALDADGSAPPAKNPDAADLAAQAPAATAPQAPKPVAPPAPTAPAKPVASAAKPAPVVPAAAATSIGFAVQVGAFAQAGEANALRDRLRAAGFNAFVEPVATDKGTLNRVRVGPVSSRAEADALKAQVAAKTGVAGMVRPHP